MRLIQFILISTLLVLLGAGCTVEEEAVPVEETGEYVLVPLGNPNTADIKFVEGALYAGLGVKFAVDESLKLYDGAYIEDRLQYDALMLLSYLEANREPNVAKVAAITDANITLAEGYNYIFGLAMLSGSCCVFSTELLCSWSDSDNLFRTRLYKICLHEVGHTFGLKHCESEGCLMMACNCVYELDDSGLFFCRKCANDIYHQLGTTQKERKEAIKLFAEENGLIR